MGFIKMHNKISLTVQSHKSCLFSLIRAFLQILGIIYFNMQCPIYIRIFFSIFKQKFHAAFEFWVSWQAEFSFHELLMTTQEISHIFPVL